MKKIGIIGATGYTGEELLKIFLKHDEVEVAYVTSEKEAGNSLSSVFPYLPEYHHLDFISAQQALQVDADLVFLCLPAGESVKLARPLFEQGIRVIDLGSDFRFHQPDVYSEWYHMPHLDPDLLALAAYGLTEWYRDEVRDAAIIGNPGCYPTCSLLPLLPLVQADLLTSAPIIIDAKSGVSGAGKSLKPETHFCSVNESFSAYKIGRVHRHVGEMEKEVKAVGSAKQIVFTPHLTPLTRGMFSTIYVQLKEQKSKDELLQILNDLYENEHFVHVLDKAPSIKMAQNTNNCFMSVETVPDSDYVVLLSTIDNLSKGASGQAVQNMNVMLGFDETKGLL